MKHKVKQITSFVLVISMLLSFSPISFGKDKETESIVTTDTQEAREDSPVKEGGEETIQDTEKGKDTDGNKESSDDHVEGTEESKDSQGDQTDQDPRRIQYTVEHEEYQALVEAPEGSFLEEAELNVREVVPEESEKKETQFREIMELVSNNLEKETKMEDAKIYDIYFTNESGEKIQPLKEVQVSILYKQGMSLDGMDKDGKDIELVYTLDREILPCKDVELETNTDGEIVSLSFKTDGLEQLILFHVVQNSLDRDGLLETDPSSTQDLDDEKLEELQQIETMKNKPATVPTVDSKAEGIKVNLFDYGGNDLDNVRNTVGNHFNTGINQGKDLWFLGTGSDGENRPYDINGFTGGKIAKQGIVKNTLENGYPKLRGSNQSLSYLFDLTPKGESKQVYGDTNHLFQKDNKGYYLFDSDQNYAYYNKEKNEFEVYKGTYDTNDNHQIGFFPFNEYDETKRNVQPGEGYNHHFGLTMEADFIIPKGGTVQGEDMVFEFSGDDDVWVFIDDVLVLDIGGIHEAVDGKINFTTGVVTVSDTMNAFGSGVTNGKLNTLSKIFENAGKKYDDSEYSEHKISFFYLERGGVYSNCKLTFNLEVYNDEVEDDPRLSVKKVWQDAQGNPFDSNVESIEVELWRRYTKQTVSKEHEVRFVVQLKEYEGRPTYEYEVKSIKVKDGGTVTFAPAIWKAPSGVNSSTGDLDIIRTDTFDGWLSLPIYHQSNITSDTTITILFDVNRSDGWLYESQKEAVKFYLLQYDEPTKTLQEEGTEEIIEEYVETITLS
ncbi:MAG TPA: fibro-slime domain-containing protein, partial [Candidatus Merdenecus merdavium]|nr:fibro-slime domain-containing protein [Candidatus Merdenecus merdavium]